MPRIYAPNEAYENNWANTPASKGVVILPESSDTSWFEDNGFTVDSSKHVSTLLDELTPAQLRRLCGYLGMTIDQGEDPDAKHTLIRAIEGEISTKYITALTIASTAGATVGTSDIAITDAGEYAYKYKTGKTTAPALLYLDYPDSTWADIETGDDIEPGAADHDKVTVVRLNAAGYVIGLGSDDLTLNTET
jgi:hypothetical protein